ncbi:MAG: hypothetical protein HYZ54_09965 [Ignavibacteriae bacterium]|nr:hypothetical protein [Ignavibacteriota bacterium]
MKIAFVGKGGSGKSSVSWLAIKTIESIGCSVLAIDADHNMDLTSNLGLDPERTPLMHKTDKEFMQEVGLTEPRQWSRLLNEDEMNLPTFTVSPMDSYTKSIAVKVSEKLSLINLGLGSPDVLFSDKCAHGLSGPLKYYLGLLNEGDDWVVIDSVAGTDMINFGLYSGIDAVIGVVEPHRNSVKVFEQINDICRKTMIPCYAVINKPTNNEFYTAFVSKYQNIILGEIPFDEKVMAYDFDTVTEKTKESVVEIINSIKSLDKRGNLISMQNFHTVKKSKA